MTAVDYASIGVGVVTVLGGVTALIQFLVKHYLSELKPNGGGSLKDQINRLETRVDKIFEILTERLNSDMARTRKKVEDDLYTPLENYCVALNEYYKALRKAGFSTDMAFWMITDKDSHPDWLLPKMPDFDPTNPDHTDWEEDD